MRMNWKEAIMKTLEIILPPYVRLTITKEAILDFVKDMPKWVVMLVNIIIPEDVKITITREAILRFVRKVLGTVEVGKEK